MRSRTAGVMTALMRNGQDRRLGEPVMGHAILERVVLFGTRSADYIRASGHGGCIATEVILQATIGRIHDRTRTLRRYVRFHLHRGHRPYMTDCCRHAGRRRLQTLARLRIGLAEDRRQGHGRIAQGHCRGERCRDPDIARREREQAGPARPAGQWENPSFVRRQPDRNHVGTGLVLNVSRSILTPTMVAAADRPVQS